MRSISWSATWHTQPHNPKVRSLSAFSTKSLFANNHDADVPELLLEGGYNAAAGQILETAGTTRSSKSSNRCADIGGGGATTFEELTVEFVGGRPNTPSNAFWYCSIE